MTNVPAVWTSSGKTKTVSFVRPRSSQLMVLQFEETMVLTLDQLLAFSPMSLKVFSSSPSPVN